MLIGQIDLIMENFSWNWNNYLICVFGINRSYVNVHFVKICCLRSSVNPRRNKIPMKPAPTDRQCCTRGTTRTRTKVFNYVIICFSIKILNQNQGCGFRIRNDPHYFGTPGPDHHLSNKPAPERHFREKPDPDRFRIKVRKGYGSGLKVMRIRNPDLKLSNCAHNSFPNIWFHLCAVPVLYFTPGL